MGAQVQGSGCQRDRDHHDKSDHASTWAVVRKNIHGHDGQDDGCEGPTFRERIALHSGFLPLTWHEQTLRED